ncbi:MAG: hypothetical protein AAGK04_07540 [Planctomycetota bacterium]
MKRVRMGIVVIVVTLLVWAFAENESLRAQSLEIAVNVRAGREDRLLTPIASREGERWDGGVQVVVEGSVASVERLRATVRDGVELVAGEELTLQEGENAVDLVAALQRHEAFRGVVVREVEPGSIDLRVDTLEELELPVRGVAEGVRLEGPPVVTPVRVVLRAPRRLIAELLEIVGDDASAVARLSESMLASLPEGRSQELQSVLVTPPASMVGEPGVTITPPTVDVRVTLRSRTASTVVSTAPVHVRLPAVELGLWDVRIVGEAVLRDVRVSGPADLVASVASGSTPVVATVPLTFEDLERGIESKAAKFATLPSPLRFEVEDSIVRLEIRRRSTPAGGE